MNNEEAAYLFRMQELLNVGVQTSDRTGTNTLSLFGHQLRFDLTDGKLPVITTKKIHLHSVLHELIWFISGDTNIKYLKDNKVRIWDEWADDDGNLGPVYGHQWRQFGGSSRDDPHNIGIDQLQNAVNLLRNDPDSRRIIVSAWNPQDVDYMALPPCHMMFQFKSYDINGTRHLSCQMYQRSADWFLGVPFNIACYATLTHMIAKITDHVASELIMTFGDTHLYTDHIEQAHAQLSRAPYEFPTIEFNGEQKEIDDFAFENIDVIGYNHYSAIKAKVSV